MTVVLTWYAEALEQAVLEETLVSVVAARTIFAEVLMLRK